jgi:hypothetical protein
MGLIRVQVHHTPSSIEAASTITILRSINSTGAAGSQNDDKIKATLLSSLSEAMDRWTDTKIFIIFEE